MVESSLNQVFLFKEQDEKNEFSSNSESSFPEVYRWKIFEMNNKHLKLAAKCAVGGVAGIGLVTVAVPLLGFSSAGVAAGSVAAAVQGMIGNIAPGSIFAALQSAGVLGTAATTKVAFAAGGVASVAAIARSKQLWPLVKKEKKVPPENEDNNNPPPLLKSKL